MPDDSEAPITPITTKKEDDSPSLDTIGCLLGLVILALPILGLGWITFRVSPRIFACVSNRAEFYKFGTRCRYVEEGRMTFQGREPWSYIHNINIFEP